jgi:hypothetical protein
MFKPLRAAEWALFRGWLEGQPTVVSAPTPVSCIWDAPMRKTVMLSEYVAHSSTLRLRVPSAPKVLNEVVRSVTANGVLIGPSPALAMMRMASS